MLLAATVALGACASEDSERAAEAVAASTTEAVLSSTAPAVTTSAPPPTSAATDAASTSSTIPVAVEFPPPALPLLPESQLSIGEPDLLNMVEGGEWLFAMRPPSVLLRIDVSSGEVVPLDLGLGESPEGSARSAYVDGSVWVIGGPFRDTLVEVDPVEMIEVRRIHLDDDHAIRQQEPADRLWLTTFRAVRPVDVVTGEVDGSVPLEVDPASIAFADDVVWVTLPLAAQVARIDHDGRIDLIDTDPGPGAVVIRDGVAWVAHSPTASISRIDVATGEVLGLTDVDIGGDAAAVTNIPGLDATDDSVWVFVTFGGTANDSAMVRLDADTGEIRSARSIQVVGWTWEATDDEIWMHREADGSIVAVDVEQFDAGPETALEALATPSTAPSIAPSTIEAPPARTVAEEDVADAFGQFVDVEVPRASSISGRSRRCARSCSRCWPRNPAARPVWSRWRSTATPARPAST